MILRFFKKYQPIVYIFIIIISIVLWIASFIHPPDIIVQDNSMPLYALLLSIIGDSKVASIILAYILVLLQAFLLTRLNMKYLFIKVRSYLPTLIFLLLGSGFTRLQILSPALIASLTILMVIDRILDTFNDNKLNYRFFEAGIILSIGSLFYAPLLYLLIIIWAALIILRPFIWREWALTIIGFLVPCIFTFSYYYIVKDDPFAIISLFSENLVIKQEIPVFNTSEWHYGIFLGLMLLLSSIFIISIFRLKKAHSRRFFIVFLSSFIASFVLYFLFPTNFDLFYIIAIPFTLILANYFSLVERKKWGNFLLFLFILMTIYAQLVSYQIIPI